MYAQLLMLKLGKGMRPAAEKIADQFLKAIKTLKGFKSITFFGDVESGEYGSLGLWASKEDAEAAAALMKPKLEQAVKGIAKAPPTRQIYEVYEPKA
jgi:heme-degrading monooxygenase HmoA